MLRYKVEKVNHSKIIHKNGFSDFAIDVLYSSNDYQKAASKMWELYKSSEENNDVYVFDTVLNSCLIRLLSGKAYSY